MSVHVFWPALSVLTMSIGMVMFIILKWGDRLCRARTTPMGAAPHYHGGPRLVADHAMGGSLPSVNDTYVYDERSENWEEKSDYREIMGSDEMLDAQEMVEVHCSGSVEAAV